MLGRSGCFRMARGSQVASLWSMTCAENLSIHARNLTSRRSNSTTTSYMASPVAIITGHCQTMKEQQQKREMQKSQKNLWVDAQNKQIIRPLDPSSLWNMGFFPEKALDEGAHTEEVFVYDIPGMLSDLPHAIPMQGFPTAFQLIMNMPNTNVAPEMQADSVLKKRRKKMNKHKLKKRRKLLRMRTKKT